MIFPMRMTEITVKDKTIQKGSIVNLSNGITMDVAEITYDETRTHPTGTLQDLVSGDCDPENNILISGFTGYGTRLEYPLPQFRNLLLP